MSASALKAKKKSRQRIHRYTSNVFSMFSQPQIQEFKEAFNMIDQNRDGFIDREDLIEMLTSLGKNPTDHDVDLMISDAPGPLNFTMFLTLFGERLNGTDPEEVIQNAFACFDPPNSGYLNEEYLRELMTTMGERWTEEQMDDLLHGAPIQQGRFNYQAFTRTLKHGAKEKDEAAADNAAPQQQHSAPGKTGNENNGAGAAATQQSAAQDKQQGETKQQSAAGGKQQPPPAKQQAPAQGIKVGGGGAPWQQQKGAAGGAQKPAGAGPQKIVVGKFGQQQPQKQPPPWAHKAPGQSILKKQ